MASPVIGTICPRYAAAWAWPLQEKRGSRRGRAHPPPLGRYFIERGQLRVLCRQRSSPISTRIAIPTSPRGDVPSAPLDSAQRGGVGQYVFHLRDFGDPTPRTLLSMDDAWTAPGYRATRGCINRGGIYVSITPYRAQLCKAPESPLPLADPLWTSCATQSRA